MTSLISIPATENIEVAAIAAALTLTRMTGVNVLESVQSTFAANYATVIKAINENKLLPADVNIKVTFDGEDTDYDEGDDEALPASLRPLD